MADRHGLMADRHGLMPAPTDDEIAQACLALYPAARAVCRDPELAADLVQDTYVRAVASRDQYRGDAPLQAWLRRILHNLAVDRHRRAARELVVEEVEARWEDDAYTVDAEATVLRSQSREELEDALVHLPFAYRSAVVLHDAMGWTVREIADAQDIGLPAAKQRLRRGRMMLVSALADGAERRHLLEGVPMRCWDARRHVSDYLNGDLDPGTARGIEAHLEHCPTCPPLYAALVGVRTGLGSGVGQDHRDPDSVIPPDLADRLRTR